MSRFKHFDSTNDICCFIFFLLNTAVERSPLTSPNISGESADVSDEHDSSQTNGGRGRGRGRGRGQERERGRGSGSGRRQVSGQEHGVQETAGENRRSTRNLGLGRGLGSVTAGPSTSGVHNNVRPGRRRPREPDSSSDSILPQRNLRPRMGSNS